MLKKFLLIITLFVTFTTTTAAQTYAVTVHGIVCEFCSYGVAKNIRKLSFIDSTQFKKGVKVDIKNQVVYIAVKNNSKLDRPTLFDAIESGGYKPIDIRKLNKTE